MKILYVVPTISKMGAGVSEIAKLTAQAVAAVPGFEVEVATFIDDQFESDIGNWENIPVHAFRTRGPSNYGFSPALSGYLMRHNPDIVHVHALWMFHCMAVHFWHLSSRKPYIVTPHGMLDPWIMARSTTKKRLVRMLYQDRFLKNASMIHLGSVKEGCDVRKLCGNLPMQVVPNYVLAAPEAVSSPAWYRPAIANRDIYLFLSRIHEKKGCGELLHAWDQLCTRNSAFKAKSALVFCGWIDGMPNFPADVELVASRHDNVSFVGPQCGDDKYSSLAAATFYVLPSKSEGLPISILEAWSAGPIVLMTEGCNLDIGFERGAAIKISPTPTSIVSGLEAASRLTADERKKISTTGRQLVNDHFSKDVVTTAFLDMYRKISKDPSQCRPF